VAITKADMETLLVELAPLPKYVGDLSADVKALRGERVADREAQIRIEEGLKGMQSQLIRINGSVASAVRSCSDNDKALERHDGKFKVVDERFAELGKQLSRLVSTAWAVLFLVIAYVVQSVLTKVLG